MARRSGKKTGLPPEVLAVFAKWGAQGGRTTAGRRTAAERKAAALKAIRARWKRYREKEKQS